MNERISFGPVGGRRLCIGPLPGRVRPCIYFWDPLTIRVLGSFRSDDACADAVRFLAHMVGKRIVWDKDELDGVSDE